jgi:hypothetical protein
MSSVGELDGFSQTLSVSCREVYSVVVKSPQLIGMCGANSGDIIVS